MTKTIPAIVLAILVAGPALAEGGGENHDRGLPEVSAIGTVAPGQASYAFDSSGRLVNLADHSASQLATVPYDEQTLSRVVAPANTQGVAGE
jgi:hypothetical protein